MPTTRQLGEKVRGRPKPWNKQFVFFQKIYYYLWLINLLTIHEKFTRSKSFTMKKYFLLFFFFFLAYYTALFAQCSGGITAGTIIPSMTPQNMSINGNNYYTFYAIGGDHYRFHASDFYNKEITILDSGGNFAGGYNHSPSGDGFSLVWTPVISGTYRALINSFPCTSFSGNLGSMNYLWVPNHFFPEDSAQWSMWFVGPEGQSSLQYKMKGDTLLNGISYNKIYTDTNINYSYNDSTVHCFIRQDTSLDKVYVRYPYAVYQDSTEYVLYDFNVEVGDTIMVHLFLNHIDYPVWITDDGIAQFNFDYRRIIGIQVVDTCPNPPCLWGPLCDYSIGWVEGIGSGLHFLYPEIGKDSCVNNNYNLQCFWHNGQYVFGGTFCDYHTGIGENFTNTFDPLFVMPNPVSDVSTLNLSTKEVASASIYNLYGQKIKFFESPTEVISIYAHDFNNGSYVVKVISKKGKISYSGFMIIN